uniref:Uncharacterized protein LOC104229750 n=1 Tax=Nicotiana sylvestris TaxID=4096 RepID=A0A1U7X2Q7_NICSY|nr:PREDICTED: uncharacterized protein LOC104229750 [Nicotiana sylvestris]
MAENQIISSVPSNTPTESSPAETSTLDSSVHTIASQNPRTESPPHSVSSPTQSSRKISTPKRFLAHSFSPTSPKKGSEMSATENEENSKILSSLMEERSKADQIEGFENIDSTKTAPDLMSTGNTPTSLEFPMGLQEKEAIENMLSIANEGVFVKESEDGLKTQGEEFETEGATEEPAGGLDPSSEDPTQGLSQEPQVSDDPAPSPHLDVEPQSVVMPEIRPVSEEQKEDSEAYSNNLPIASLPRRRLVVDEEPTPKRPTTRLQKKEALESTLKNSHNVLKELGEKSVKSDKKEKSDRKTAKRKDDTNEEPGFTKKARVGDPRSAGEE